MNRHFPFFILHSSFPTLRSSFPTLRSSFFIFNSSFPTLRSSFFIFNSSFHTLRSSFFIFNFSFLIPLFSFFILNFSFPALASPQPSFNYYGQITTELGLPFPAEEGATLLVRSGTRIIARAPIDRTAVAGCNYLAEIPLDSDATPYRDYALQTGATVTFALLDAHLRETTLYPVGPIPPVGRTGASKRLDLSAGCDSLGNGLTDAFRQHILAASQGQFSSIEQILPNDDFDGDGLSNADEFRSGTDATWAADFLQVAQFRPTQGTLAFEFFAVEGIAYRVYGCNGTDADGQFTWTPTPWSSAPESAPESAPFTGRGRLATLYLTAEQDMKFFKLIIE